MEGNGQMASEANKFLDAFKAFVGEMSATIGLKLLLGIVILIVGLKLSKWVVKLVSKGRGFKKLDKSVQGFIKSFVKVILYALVISSACMCWGVPSTSFMTIFTSAGVAIGLALQGALSNFAGGLMILFFKPFAIGDYIESGAVAGTVEDISIIYTILLTPDNKKITVPNGTLTNSNVINYSACENRRVDLTISAGYENDVEQVKSILLKTAYAHEKVLKDPSPMARLQTHSSSSLDYAFRVWVKKEDYWTVYFDLMENVKQAFDENGITIPYQQIDVAIKK